MARARWASTNVKVDSGLLGRRVGSAVEQGGFEERDAVEAPGSVGHFLNELRFGCSGRFVFVEEAAAVVFVGGPVFGGEDGGSGRQPMGEGILRRALFAGGGARSGRFGG